VALTTEERNYLLAAGWSGGVMAKPLPNGLRICIINPNHSRCRNKITLMEEICHIFLKHVPTEVRKQSDGLASRDYNKAQETEAYGTGAAVLLPWATFYHALNAGGSILELAERYDVTPELIKYRIKITGASKLYASRQRGE
jgi:Zn-dependent peptidase ImmA (M78 family)